MQVESSRELWIRQRQEVEEHRLRCCAGDFELRFADGEIVVRSVGPVCTARIIWDHEYGERALERGPYASVHAHIGRILRNGPTFGPVHEADGGALRFVKFESDDSFRATRPHGEVRVKRFLDQYVLLFVPDGGIRLLHVSKDPNQLKQAADLYGPEWASCSGPRYAVRFEGRSRELHVSHNPSELAYHEIDEHTRFSLRPHSLPEGDRPAQAALYLFRAGEQTELLALVPVEPTSHESVIWSDELPVRPGPAPGTGRTMEASRSDERPTEAPGASSTARPPEAAPPGSGGMPPGLRALVARYLRDIAERPGGGGEMRAQCEGLLRAAERGDNLSGWGVPLRRALERACECKFDGSPRAFAYLVKALKDDGILARPWGRKCQFVFAELHRPDSPAIALLCQRFGVTPESVLGTVNRPTVDPPATGRPPTPSPTGRLPPTTPPPSVPTPAVREYNVRTSSPPTSPPAAPATPPVEPAPGTESRAFSPDQRENALATLLGPAPDRPAERGGPPPPPQPPQPPAAPPVATGQPEGPFAAVQKLLSVDTVRAGASAVPVPPIAPVSPDPDDDFLKEEFLFLNRRILRSAAEPTDEYLEVEDSDGSPRGPPDEE